MPDDTTKGLREQAAEAARLAFAGRVDATGAPSWPSDRDPWVALTDGLDAFWAVISPVLVLGDTGGLRERLIARLDGEPLFGAAETVDALLAELAGVPGDLPARMAAAMRRFFDDRPFRPLTAGFFEDLAAAAVSVVQEHAASQAAEVERLRARAEDLLWKTASEGQRADEAEAQVERLRAELAEAERRIGHFEAARELSERDYKHLADQLFASCICDCNPETTDGPEEDCPVHGADEHRPLSLRKRASEAEAERDTLKAAIERGEVARFAADVRRLISDYASEERGVIALMPFEATLDQLCLEKYGFDLDKAVAALDTPETPAAPPCPRCGGSMVEPGTEEEGDWDSAAMRHHPYTGEPCTACNGSGKAAPETTGDAQRSVADQLAEHRALMVDELIIALPYIEGWTADLTRNQGGAVIDAVLDAVRKAEAARSPGDTETADRPREDTP